MKVPNRWEAAAHNCTIPELINEHFQNRPDEEALCSSDGESMTYRTLDTTSQLLANHLAREYGIGPEIIVPLCFEKSIWTGTAQPTPQPPPSNLSSTQPF